MALNLYLIIDPLKLIFSFILESKDEYSVLRYLICLATTGAANLYDWIADKIRVDEGNILTKAKTMKIALSFELQNIPQKLKLQV